jgi:hypothetical protein
MTRWKKVVRKGILFVTLDSRMVCGECARELGYSPGGDMEFCTAKADEKCVSCGAGPEDFEVEIPDEEKE